MKPKSLYMRIFNVLLTVAAYGYLVYRLVVFDGYTALADSWGMAGSGQLVCLLVAVLLVPLNVVCEAWKWQTLLRDVEPMGIREAQRQVYYGYVGAFVTPYRAGDYPARVMLLSDSSAWAAAVALGLVGSLALLVVEVCLGVPAVVLLTNYETGIDVRNVLIATAVGAALLVLVPVCLWRLAHRKWRIEQLNRMFGALAQLTGRRFTQVVLISLLRYTIWAVQLTLVLRFCGVVLTPVQLLLTIPTYYLLLGVVPSVPVADIAVRGSLSIVVFGVFSPNTAGIAIAVTVIWIINTILPMVVGTWVGTSGKYGIGVIRRQIN